MSMHLFDHQDLNIVAQVPFIREVAEITYYMWQNGWDERNAGNVSCLLDEEEVARHIDIHEIVRTLPLSFPVPELAGKYLIVTGSGKYFRHMIAEPEANLGVIRINEAGSGVDILWGLANEAEPTSELAAHLMTHVARRQVDPEHRVIIHTHATNIIAMSIVHELDESKLTRTLWQMCTECIVIFPDGVGVLPWIVPGTNEIGRLTAEKMKDTRIVIWPHHGIFGTGSSIDDAFGLIETVEKAAGIYMQIAHLPIKQLITDHQLHALAQRYGVVPVSGILQL
ncbi:rhamnulose-1-phosphate aldolase [Paenibacillus albiflavus]|uniref:Rhamnulose-1-phosphate aldolase n=1 Tax=Paenibacillus albiflavus TaxID=2545760 RepID=A0A4R4EI57_9BACL|nr:rhamnulose-1-phosphate aldolase [Paenibacillus albiflavus]TCZ77865.1 rhamnulose-1-phosphate aldolase [Paenibacillus albiflavus]